MHFKQTVEKLDQMLHISDSFDLIRRPLTIGGTSAMLYMVDGFVKDDILEKIMELPTGSCPRFCSTWAL